MPVHNTNDGLWPIDACDVQDKERLRRFRQKRADWLDWLKGDDDHSIRRQIRNMTGSYLTWLALNESRSIADERGYQSAAKNWMLAEFLDVGFAATQALAIRRLVEPEANNKKRQVISLRRLTDDLSLHCDLFTREIFVGFSGAPYDPQPGRDRFTAKILSGIKEKLPVSGAVDALSVGPEAWAVSDRLNRFFDSLVGRTVDIRNRNDRIPEQFFADLSSSLKSEAVKNIKELCDKRIAHAADLFSRSRVEYKEFGISVDDIDAAHFAILTVAEILFLVLCHEPLDFIPRGIYDQFKFLDRVWLDEGGVEELRRLWEGRVEDREERINKAAERFMGISGEAHPLP